MLDIEPDQLTVLIATLLLLPMGYIFSRIQDVELRQWVNFIFCFGIGFSTVGINVLCHSLLRSLVVYYLCMNLTRRQALISVWIWALGSLLVIYILRLSHQNDGHTLDDTMIHMIVTTKITAFASNYYNGDSADKSNKYWTKYQIKKLPVLSDFLGYIYFYPTYLIGPFIEYQDYNDYIKLTNPPKSDRASKLITCIGSTTLVLVILLWLKPWFPANFMLTADWNQYSLSGRVVYCYLAMLAVRLQYEFIWSFIDMTSIVSGLAYEENGGWNKCNNMDLTFEFSTSVRDMTQKWNITIATWLRHHWYERFESTNKIAAMISTNMLSAFWHGLYIGYYLAFGFGSLILYIGRKWHLDVEPYVKPAPTHAGDIILYHCFNIIVSSLCLTFVFVPFVFLNLPDIIVVFQSFYFIPLIYLFGSLILTHYTPLIKS